MDTEYGALFKIEDVKASDGGGWEVAGYVSTYGNTDHGGDVVMRGAFDATLESNRPVRFLFAHDTRQVLGVSKSLKSDDKGLFGTFKISKTALGEDVHTLLKDGALDSFSIGYVPTEVEFDDIGTRLLKSIDLLEASLVSIPMNDRAVVTRVKAAYSEDYLQGLALAEHLALEARVAGPLGDKLDSFLSTLLEQGQCPTDTKRQALTEILETFSRWDRVRSKAEQLLQLAPADASGDWHVRLQLAQKMLAHRGHLATEAA